MVPPDINSAPIVIEIDDNWGMRGHQEMAPLSPISMSKTIQELRARAVAHSLFKPTSLKAAVLRLGFIQADPIRSPARAQDLILRQRVKGYKTGDLERGFPSLDIEEDVLYAYGFVHRRIWELLHPRESVRLSKLEKSVLDAVVQAGPTHPATLQETHGRKRVINAWGGYSKATTQALEGLHYRGRLRIAKRENGIRIYEAARPCPELPRVERLEKLILGVVNILAPVPIQTLNSNVARYAHLGTPRATVRRMITDGDLEIQVVDELEYVSLPQQNRFESQEPIVRFLAPFDPLVWDRRRFEHLWGWAYRFEAYTPPAKRQRGYYAMPMLWKDDIIGWANANIRDGMLSIDVGFAKSCPRSADFRYELKAESERLASFLGVDMGDMRTDPSIP
jgi:uncharacterized protein YcaQ